MSIQSEITRLSGAKSDIADAIEAKGVTVPSSTKLSGYAPLISQIAIPPVYSVVISPTAPTSTEPTGWIDSDDTGYEAVPQINDTQTSVNDTYSSSKIHSTYLAFGASQTLTETEMTQLYANMGFPTNTLGKLGYTVVS